MKNVEIAITVGLLKRLTSKQLQNVRSVGDLLRLSRNPWLKEWYVGRGFWHKFFSIWGKYKVHPFWEERDSIFTKWRLSLTSKLYREICNYVVSSSTEELQYSAPATLYLEELEIAIVVDSEGLFLKRTARGMDVFKVMLTTSTLSCYTMKWDELLTLLVANKSLLLISPDSSARHVGKLVHEYYK